MPRPEDDDTLLQTLLGEVRRVAVACGNLPNGSAIKVHIGSFSKSLFSWRLPHRTIPAFRG